MAPFVAHQLLKHEGIDYKWLLYGDDDTMWFLSAVADLLRDYDADLPYFISGMTAQHPILLVVLLLLKQDCIACMGIQSMC